MYNQHAHFLLCAHLRVSLWQELTFFIISYIVFKCCFQMMGIKCFIFIAIFMLDSVTLFKKNISNFLSIKIIQLLCYNFVSTFLIPFFHVIHLLNHLQLFNVLQLSKHTKGFPFFHYVIDVCFLR